MEVFLQSFPGLGMNRFIDYVGVLLVPERSLEDDQLVVWILSLKLPGTLVIF